MGEEGEACSLEQYREMTAVQRKRLKKDNLLTLLDESIENNPVEQKLDEILRELKSVNDKWEKCDAEIKRVDQVVDNHSKILSAQQRFMESLDAEKRAKHLIILGLKEDGEGTDLEKFQDIITVIGLNPENIKAESIERLGTRDENEPNRTRPIKISLEKSQMRYEILKKSNKLRDQAEGSIYRKIFLKKDVHPDIRAEEKRLYEVFKAERDKPENVGKEVLFDRKTRVVTVNADVVDRFKLFSSFQ